MWRTLPSDPGAAHDRSLTIDASALAPMVSYGTNPGMSIPVAGALPNPRDIADPQERPAVEKALRYMGLEPGRPIAGQHVDVAFLGSCTNARLSDLRAAAGVMRGRHVAPRVRMLVVPGSQPSTPAGRRALRR